MNQDTYDDQDLFDEEEIDIVKLVSTNANDANQYLLFLGSDKNYYAKNVSKIEEIVVLKNLDIINNYDNSFIIGVADIRGELLSLVSFDTWLTGQEYDKNKNEFVIIVNYGGHKFGLVVSEVEYITTIEPKLMQASTNGNSKSTFTTKISINNKECLCTIIDSDKLLFDAFKSKDEQAKSELESSNINIDSNKKVFIADDSRLIQGLMAKVCNKLELNYEIFENGKELLDNISKHDKNDIGLVITDVEMPILGGKELLKSLRENPDFDEVNILMHTNMANNVMQKELRDIGATDIICKVDMKTLSNSIKSFIK